MSFLDKYNHKPLFQYDHEQERDFINLEGLVKHNGINQIYVLQAIFINTKSRYGDAPIFVIDHYMVDAPRHLLDTVKEMLEDTEFINMVNGGHVGFKVYQYEGKNGKGYSVEWLER